MSMDRWRRQGRGQIRHQRDAARRRHAGAAHHHDAGRAAVAAGRQRQAAVGEQRHRPPGDEQPDGDHHRPEQGPLPERQADSGRRAGDEGQRRAREPERESGAHQGGRGSRVLRGDGDDGPAPAGGRRGHRPRHRPRRRPPAARREPSNGSRTSPPRRRQSRHWRNPACQLRHERHAVDRRAAGVARHLHVDLEPHPEGRRHQPAGRDQDGRPTSRPTSARSC